MELEASASNKEIRKQQKDENNNKKNEENFKSNFVLVIVLKSKGLYC